MLDEVACDDDRVVTLSEHVVADWFRTSYSLQIRLATPTHQRLWTKSMNDTVEVAFRVPSDCQELSVVEKGSDRIVWHLTAEEIEWDRNGSGDESN